MDLNQEESSHRGTETRRKKLAVEGRLNRMHRIDRMGCEPHLRVKSIRLRINCRGSYLLILGILCILLS